MAKKEECSNCPKAKSGGYKGEIHCAYYGRMPKYDGSACTYYDNRQCPKCGAEINTSLLVCPSCGQTLKQKPQPIENRGKEDKRTIFTLLGILLLGILATLAFALSSNISYKNNVQKKEVARQEMLNAQRVAEEKRIEEERIEEERNERLQRQVPQWLLGEWEKDETQIDPSTYDIITLTLVVTSDGYKVTQSRSNGGTYSLGSQRWEGYRTEGHAVYTDNGSVQFSYDESKKQLTYSNATWHKRW